MTAEDIARNIPLSDCLCFERQHRDLCPQHQRVADAIRAAAVAEREACARLAESQVFYPDTHTGKRQQWVKEQIAAAIRQRGNA